MRAGTAHHCRGAKTKHLSSKHLGNAEERGTAQGSSTRGSSRGSSTGLPWLTRAGWGPGLQMVNARQRGQVSKSSHWDTSPKSSAPETQEGFWKTWPPGCKPHDPECFRKIHTATYILSPTHTAAYIISTTARGEIYINDPLSFFLLKAAGYRIWQPGSWWYSSQPLQRGCISSTRGPIPWPLPCSRPGSFL